MSKAVDVKVLVEQSFNTKEATGFWHYTVKRCRNKNDYTPTIVDERIQTIQEKLKEQGGNSFERQGAHGFTPLHIVTIIGNAVGLQFLFSKKVNRGIKDEFGKRPVDYARELHPELLELFSFPYQTSSDMSVIEDVLKKWKVKIPSTGVSNENTDDFGRQIKRLLLGVEIKDSEGGWENTRVLQDLKLVCKRIGVAYEQMGKKDGQVFLRDLWIRTHKGKVLQPFVSGDHQQKAIDRMAACSTYFNQAASTRTNNRYFKAHSGNAAFISSDEAEKAAKYHKCKVTSAGFTFDGGNCLTLTNSKGEIKALIGLDHHLVTTHLYRLEKEIYTVKMLDPSLSKIYSARSSNLTTDKVKKLAEELYAQGLLLIDGNSGFIDPLHRMAIFECEWRDQTHKPSTDPDKHSYRETALKLDFLKPFQSAKIDDMNKIKEMVERYEWQKFMAHYVTAESLGVDLKSALFVAQGDYHLDCFLRPGPNQTVFIQDYQFCAELLNILIQQAKSLGLTEKDRTYLERYFLTAKKFHLEVGPLLNEVKEQLTGAGFIMVPMPAVLMYEPEDFYKNRFQTTYSVNFMNAVSGWSDVTKKYFYISTGAHVGDRLGAVLMDMFHAFLQMYIPTIETYFVGRDPKNGEDFSEAMTCWNNKGLQRFGIHCMTFELDAAEHKDADEHKDKDAAKA